MIFFPFTKSLSCKIEHFYENHIFQHSDAVVKDRAIECTKEKLMCSTDTAVESQVDQTLLLPNIVTPFRRPREIFGVRMHK